MPTGRTTSSFAITDFGWVTFPRPARSVTWNSQPGDTNSLWVSYSITPTNWYQVATVPTGSEHTTAFDSLLIPVQVHTRYFQVRME